jgi:hypothetical protein
MVPEKARVLAISWEANCNGNGASCVAIERQVYEVHSEEFACLVRRSEEELPLLK